MPAKATLLGTGTTSGDLTKATKYTVYTTVDGFASAAGQDVYATNYSVTTPTSVSGGGGGDVIAIGAGLLVLAALASWLIVVRRKPDAGPQVVVASPNATQAPPDCSKAEVAAAEAMVKEVAQKAHEHYHQLGALTVEGAVHGFIDESGDELENEIAQDSESAQWRLERAQAALQACREGRSPDGVGGDGFEPVPPVGVGPR